MTFYNDIQSEFDEAEGEAKDKFKAAKKAYRKLSRQYHPDKKGKKESFQDLANAWERFKTVHKEAEAAATRLQFPLRF